MDASLEYLLRLRKILDMAALNSFKGREIIEGMTCIDHRTSC